MKVQVTHTITRNGKVIVTKGDVITESQSVKKKVTNYVIPYVGKKNRYTEEECDTILRLYLNNPNRRDVSNEFVLIHTDGRHTNDSIQQMVSQLETLDVTHPNSTEYNISGTLRRVSMEYSPERFG